MDNSEPKPKGALDTAEEVPAQSQDDYLLSGLMRNVKSSDPDLFILSLGTDPSSLGIDFRHPDVLSGKRPLMHSMLPLYATSDKDTKRRVFETMDGRMTVKTPNSYLPGPANSHPWTLLSRQVSVLEKFSLETLFYIFYCMTRELLQGFAAAELCKRGWMYRIKNQKWFYLLPSDNTNEDETDSHKPPTDTTESMPRSWKYFEPSSWTIKEISIVIEEEEFMSIALIKSLVEKTTEKLAETYGNFRPPTNVSARPNPSGPVNRQPDAQQMLNYRALQMRQQQLAKAAAMSKMQQQQQQHLHHQQLQHMQQQQQHFQQQQHQQQAANEVDGPRSSPNRDSSRQPFAGIPGRRPPHTAPQAPQELPPTNFPPGLKPSSS